MTQHTPGWWVATLVCRMCGAQQVAMYPEDVFDETAMECEECGHMTAEPPEDSPEEPQP